MKKQKFFGVTRQSTEIAAQEERAGIKDKKNQRDYEQQHMKPDPIPAYTGVKPEVLSELEKLKVLLVFHSHKDLKIFSKYFKIAKYKAQSVPDIRLLLALLREFEKGKIKYDTKNDKIRYRRNRTRSTEVVTRK